MPGGPSTFLADALLDHVLSGPDYSPTATYTIRLYTGTMNSPADGVEVSGGSYSPVTLTRTDPNWNAATGGLKTNAVAFDFGTATANWGSLVGAKVVDDDDEVLMWGPFTVARTVNSGDPFAIPAGAGVFTLAGAA